MKCPVCLRSIDNDSVFCSWCGERVASEQKDNKNSMICNDEKLAAHVEKCGLPAYDDTILKQQYSFKEQYKTEKVLLLNFPPDSAEIRLTISRGIDVFDSFAKYKSLRRIVISGDVSVIPDRAFEGCRSLEKVSFVDCQVSLFGKELFAGCSSLERINLPDAAFLREGTLDYPEVSRLNCIAGSVINAAPGVFGSQTEAMLDKKIFLIRSAGENYPERMSLRELLR